MTALAHGIACHPTAVAVAFDHTAANPEAFDHMLGDSGAHRLTLASTTAGVYSVGEVAFCGDGWPSGIEQCLEYNLGGLTAV